MTKNRLISMLIVLVLCWTHTVHASENRFFVGVSVNTDFRDMRPWIDIDITQSHPNSINKFRPFEIHHAYAGIGLYLMGRLFDSKSLRVIGAVLLIDDLGQHILRVNSPAHMLNDELWKWKPYRKLVEAVE